MKGPGVDLEEIQAADLHHQTQADSSGANIPPDSAANGGKDHIRQIIRVYCKVLEEIQRIQLVRLCDTNSGSKSEGRGTGGDFCEIVLATLNETGTTPRIFGRYLRLGIPV